MPFLTGLDEIVKYRKMIQNDSMQKKPGQHELRSSNLYSSEITNLPWSLDLSMITAGQEKISSVASGTTDRLKNKGTDRLIWLR